MSTRELPARPNLEFLKNQAYDLHRQGVAGEPAAVARFKTAGVRAPLQLADALHVLAREYGFATWPALKLHVESIAGDAPRTLAAAIRAQDAAAVAGVLTRYPGLRNQINEPLGDDAFGAPPLLAAAQQNNRTLVDTLLDAGADVNARSRWWAGSFGVLDCASAEMAEHLIARGARADIHAAARLGKIERVRELLREDPGLVHARGGDGQLPLHFAATVEIAALLLEHGADMDARDIDHESTAVQYMVCQRHLLEWREPYRHDVARHLIARGAQADIIAASALGDVALAERLLNDDPELVRVTVSERNFPKRDPRAGGVIYAYGFGWSASPHMIARQFGHQDVYALLLRRSPNWLRLVHAAETGDAALAAEIIGRHPDVCARLSPRAARRIIGCALRNNTAAIAMLLERGWPATAELDNRQTALHYAAWNGNLAMVRLLLEHGAAAGVQETEHGGTPLDWASHGAQHSEHRASGDYPGVIAALTAATIPRSPE